MRCKNVRIGDVVTYRKDSIKPMAGVAYRCYSLPAFDNSRSPEILDGSEILSPKLKIEKGDILVNKLNMRFKRIWPLNEIDDNSVCSTEFLPLHPKESVDPNYLLYTLLSDSFTKELSGMRTGTSGSHQRVKPEWVLGYRFNLPDLNLQRKIGNVLATIDSKIASNTKINGYLAALLDASYSLATENGAEVKTLPEVVDIFSGGTPKTGNPEYWEGGNIPFFAPGDVTRSVYALTTEKHITEMGLANCNSSLYPIDTVFLTARGTVGKVAIAGNPMAMNQSCFAFRGKDIPQSVVFQIIKHAVKSLKAKANGATFAAINTRDLGIERVAIPSKDAMHAYDRDASVWLSEILTNEKEDLRLANLRDALLPKLMSGEIDVSRVDLTQLNSHLSGY